MDCARRGTQMGSPMRLRPAVSAEILRGESPGTGKGRGPYVTRPILR